jgi:hypothetical protein
VTFGGAHTPYVGHTAGEDRFVELPKVVLAYGTVEGQWWSYTGFESRGTGDYVDGAYSNVPEPCSELMFDSTGSGGADCLDPPTSDLQVDTQSFDATGADGQPAPLPALAVLGVVSPGVDPVGVTLLDGQSRTLVLLDGPPGVPAKYFVLFIPPSDQAVLGPLGHVSAFGADGTALATQTVCQPGDGALCVSDAP